MKPTTLKMLIVDDDRIISAMLQRFFEGLDYSIFTVETGEEAFKFCLEQKPDILITDIMLPQMSGIELITKLRSMHEFAVMPIIALTAESIETQEKAKQAGAHLVLEKPIKRLELMHRVDELLRATPFIPRF